MKQYRSVYNNNLSKSKRYLESRNDRTILVPYEVYAQANLNNFASYFSRKLQEISFVDRFSFTKNSFIEGSNTVEMNGIFLTSMSKTFKVSLEDPKKQIRLSGDMILTTNYFGEKDETSLIWHAKYFEKNIDNEIFFEFTK